CRSANWPRRNLLPACCRNWAMAARAWRLDAEEALSAWFWSWLENQLAVLMKTLPLGQLAAQKLASSLLPELGDGRARLAPGRRGG
ncbi:urease accessory UreF family protein, partial [Pseudomonas aeruginosa]